MEFKDSLRELRTARGESNAADENVEYKPIGGRQMGARQNGAYRLGNNQNSKIFRRIHRLYIGTYGLTSPSQH